MMFLMFSIPRDAILIPLRSMLSSKYIFLPLKKDMESRTLTIFQLSPNFVRFCLDYNTSSESREVNVCKLNIGE